MSRRDDLGFGWSVANLDGEGGGVTRIFHPDDDFSQLPNRGLTGGCTQDQAAVALIWTANQDLVDGEWTRRFVAVAEPPIGQDNGTSDPVHWQAC